MLTEVCKLPALLIEQCPGQKVDPVAGGAVTGGAGGLLSADEERARLIKNCMRNRGYAVLN